MSTSSFSVLQSKRILVTGGNGYIGSHTVLKLLESANIEIVIVDSLINSNKRCYDTLRKIGETSDVIDKSSLQALQFVQADLCNKSETEQKVFVPLSKRGVKFDACIHFAGLKAVGESVSQPLRYYDNNVGGTISLLQLCEQYECRNFVFSSSATVYGKVETNPITESFPLSTTNAYGSTKLVIEGILRELCSAPNSQWRVAILRYFNPIGAHKSGLIGEDPAGIPNNLLPYVLQVAVGREGRKHVTVHGNDWPTEDGTGVRDFIHVDDLAVGHLAALANAIFTPESMQSNCEAYNLGTGTGHSVMDVIKATEKACGHKIDYVVGARRPGDISACFSDPSKAQKELKWKAIRELDEAVADSWRWQQKNPHGFDTQA